MNRLLISLLLFFVMGLTTLQVGTETTLPLAGPTTNSQTNTSGSNTTISGGYSQESHHYISKWFIF